MGQARWGGGSMKMGVQVRGSSSSQGSASKTLLSASYGHPPPCHVVEGADAYTGDQYSW